ncbi:MAG: YajD family HNH nuclease [Desulfobaccales bacterium]
MEFQNDSYREQSLRIHGMVCAKCGREFTQKNRKQLTVHHKDGNPRNNPKDGSNWENLCIYCHDDEHSRQLLADYLSGK